MSEFKVGDTVKVLYLFSQKLPEGSFGHLTGVHSEEPLRYNIDLFLPDYEIGIPTVVYADHILPFAEVEIPVVEIPAAYEPQNLPPTTAYLRLLEQVSAGKYAIKMNHWKSYRQVATPLRLLEIKKAYEDYTQSLRDLLKEDIHNVFYGFFRGYRELFEEAYSYVAGRNDDIDALIEEMFNFVNVFYGYRVQAISEKKNHEALADALKNARHAKKRLDSAWRRWEESSSQENAVERPITDDLFGAYAYLVSQQDVLIDILLAGVSNDAD